MEEPAPDQNQRDSYNRFMMRLWNSQAYLDFCEDLYGYRFCLLNSLFSEQYRHLFHELSIDPEDTVLDIGCGSGAVLSAVVEFYSCRGIGIDYAPDLITAVRNRYPDISFHDMAIENMKTAPVKADVIISLDSLYTCRDLTATFTGLRNRCRKCIYVYYTQEIEEPAADTSMLQPDNTAVAVALKENRLSYSVLDFSSDESNLWKHESSILDKHRLAFEKEGNLVLWTNRLEDTERMLAQFNLGRARRFFYAVQI